MKFCFRKLVVAGGLILAIFINRSAAQAPTLPMNDENPLRMPVVGDHSLRLLNSNVVEVMMVTLKDPDPAPLNSWNFINATGVGSLPAASSFTVSVNGQTFPITGVGFKRRVLYAPLRVRDMRVANWLYLQLGAAIPADAVVTVQNPGNVLWANNVIFAATNSAQRYSPSIHVNQAGYVANFAKKAMVGQYLGTLGEMPIPSGAGFQLVNAANGTTAFTGTLTRRPDVGYSYTPTPYQQVFEADFTSFNTPGEYKLFVPGLGVSFPFYIDEGMAATYARTYALGLYHNRCGTDNSMPFTRHTHAACHTNLIMVPTTAGPEQTFVNYVLNNESAGAASNPRHTAPRMTSINASLYPFVNTAPFDGRGGHHDAGDYSKYTTSVSAFIHYLCFAVDSLPGVKDLDNLGIPESGDGISDVMQEAKWEADYLAKLQDADGGFYFIVYPRTRQYELDSLPEQGDAQLVLPKNTAATAAAVAALANMASSPTFKATYPTAASNYLAKAVKGWQFLQNAIATHGSDGSYQMITFSGDTFMHDDELAWAAAALYAATGDAAYESFLRTKMPNPNSQSLRRWSWWSMFGGWGNATRDYAFAARSGRLAANKLDPTYLAQCEAEIKFAGSNAVDWSAKMAYGSSFTDDSKGLRVAGWYFSGEWTMDPAVAWVIDPSSTTKALYLDAILKNYNYEMGCNPVNVTYLTGLGSRRQREIVHQYALNDRRVLPPAGIPLGNIQAQYDYLQLYKTELSAISYPTDDSPGFPYAYYDRWADTFNVSTEFVISQTAKTLPAAVMLMAMTPTKTQVWSSATAQIVNLPASGIASQPVTPSLVSSVDLSKARILWESGNNIARQEPFIGASYTFTPGNAGQQWVEAEAQLPDGRRIVVATNFTAIMAATNTIEQYQTIPLAQNTNVVAWYKLDTSYADASGHQANLAPAGNVALDNGSFAWINRPGGAALRVNDLGDKVTVNLPNASLSSGPTTSAMSIEAMFYVNRQMAYGRGNANLFTLTKGWNAEIALRHNIWTAGPALTGGATVIADNVTLANYLKTGQWQHFKVRLTSAGYTLSIDGQTVATVASADLANWGGSGNAVFEVGNFDGWVDEIVVKNEGGSVVVTNPPPPVGTAAVSVAATANASEGTLTAGSFQISRNSTAATNLTVNFAISGNATSAADYTALPASVVIPAGSTAATITVTPLQDTTFEGNETVTLTITANAAYSIGTATANVTIVDDDPDSRPPPPGQTNYVTVPTTLNTNIVALYHFDGNLADASGRQPNLTLVGLAAQDASNLNWMSSPSGSALRVSDLGDAATVTLNNVNLYTPGVTASLGVEAFVFVKEFTAYSQKPGTLFKLAKRWDAQMIYNQDTWQRTPELWGGVAKVIDVAALAPYLQTNCWQKIGVFLDETGYFVKVNDVEVARSISLDITKWAGAGNVDVEIGSFDGWVDELAIRSNVKGYVPPPTTNSQTITFGALAAKTFGDAAFTLNATASSGLPVSYTSGNTSVATVSGNTVTIIGAGSAVITASQAGNANYTAAANVTQTLTVNKAAATVTLSGLSAIYDGAAKSATTTTTPNGLPVTITYNGSGSAPVNAGSYAVVATVNHANYTGSANGTLVISQPSQTITFGALAAKTFGTAAFTLNATASSGLPVSYASGNTSVATVSGNTVTIVGAGSAVITASQAGNANYTAAANVSQTLTVNKAAATVSLSGLAATFDGSAKNATATTTPSGLPVTLTYNGSGSAPVNAGSYAVVATVNHANYTGSATGTLVISQPSQTITFGALAAKTFGDAAFTLNATASSGLPVSYTSGNTSVATVSGNTVTIVGAGSAVITASQAGNANYTAAANVSQTLTVNKAAATVSLSGLSAIYDGAAKSAIATTTPNGLPVTITYNGSGSAPVNAGSYAVVATINHANYTGSANGTLVISQPSQTITFGALAAKTFGDAAFTLNATASSGLPVSYTSGNTSVATVSGNTVTIVGAGSAVITASQAGNANYTAAANVSQTLTVNKAAATVSLSGLSATYDGTAKSVSATTTPSGLPVTITYNGSGTAPLAVGSYAVAATINHANYSGSASGTLLINQPTNQSQTITFGALAARTFGDAAFTLNATASSGLPVSFVSGNTSVAVVSGNTVTIVGAGSAVITASQAGSGNYNPATPVLQTLTVNKAAATVSLSGLSATYDGTAKSVSATTTPSGLPATLTYNGSGSAPANAGSYAVVATINHANYTGSASGTLVISQPSQTITFGALAAKTFGDATFTLNATASSGLPVSYVSGNTSVATVSGNTVTIIGAGSAVITASQAGNANYTAAANVTQTLTVNKAAATVTLSGLSATYDGTAKSVSATTTPSGLPVTLTYNGSGSAPVNAGSYAVVATINHANYTGSASGTLVISQPSQTITFGALAAKTFGTAAFTLNATASSGLPVSYVSGNTSVATVSGNTVTIVGAGSAVITASQAGNANYTAAANVSQTLTVNKAAATVSLSGLAATFDGSAKNATATTTPSGLPLTLTYNGSGSAPVNAGSYAVVATINHANYTGSASGTLVIANVQAPVTLTVLTQGQGAVSPDLNGHNLIRGTNITLTAQPATGWVFDGWSVDGSVVSTNLAWAFTADVSLTVTAQFSDAIAPSVAITSLSTNAGRGTAPTMILSGVASDNAGVHSVEFAVQSAGVMSDYVLAYGTTNWSCDLPAPAYGTNIIYVRARDFDGNISKEAKRVLNYVVKSPLSLSVIGKGSVSPYANGQQLELGRTYTITAAPQYGNAFDRWQGSVTSSNRVLSFVMSEGLALQAKFRETSRPIVSIVSPAAGARTTNSLATFIGKASDSSGLERVEYAFNEEDFKPAIGTTNWTVPVTLRAGTNVFRIRAVDQAGNVSLPVTRSVFHVVTSPLGLWVNGRGTVSGATNGQRLEIGRSYKLTAKPASGQIFAEWSEGSASQSSSLTFLMQPGLILQANFVTNPFTLLKGSYQALFYEADQVRHDRSGQVKFTVGSLGSYSASVKLGAKSVSLTGNFNWRGQATLNVSPGTSNAAAIRLQLDTTNAAELCTGTVSNANWFAGLSGYRTPVYSTTNRPTARRYTFVIPADDSSTNNPAGLGYGTLSVDANGLGTLGGKLGDGTAFTVATPLGRGGFFPLYSQLYSSLGSALSWLRFTNQPMSDFDGALSWSKPRTATNTAYAAGFQVESFCVGSLYSSTNTPLLSLTNSPMEFSGGALGAGFINQVTLQSSGTLLNLSTNKLSFTLTKQSGMFSGYVTHPLTRVSIPYGGVIFQKWNAALGHATLSKQTSALKLDAAE